MTFTNTSTFSAHQTNTEQSAHIERARNLTIPDTMSTANVLSAQSLASIIAQNKGVLNPVLSGLVQGASAVLSKNPLALAYAAV